MPTTYRILPDGMGGFLCPPGHPNLTHSVQDRDGSWAIDTVAEAADLFPDTIRNRARAMVASAELVESELWVRSVYGYFRNMWTPDGTSRHVHLLVNRRPEGAPDDWHAAVLAIRQYFPDHAPRADLIADPGNGYGAHVCTKCDLSVQYEARFDALTFVQSPARGETGWHYVPECPMGGAHQITD